MDVFYRAGVHFVMIENINDLPIELLVHVFSFLPSKDLIGVSRICKKWAAMVSDDNIWREAFVKIWGRAPDIRLTKASDTWRDEYLARSKAVSHWSRRQPQKVQYSVDQVNGLSDCYFWRAKDGQPRFAAVSHDAIMTVSIESGQKLNRSVSYVNSEMLTLDHESGLLATANRDNIRILSNSNLNSFTVISEFSLKDYIDNAHWIDSLKWISTDTLAIIVAGHDSQKLLFVDISNSNHIEERYIGRYVSFNQCYTRGELNDDSIAKDEMCTIMGKDIFWLNAKLIVSSAPEWRTTQPTWKFYKLSEKLLLRISMDQKWSILGIDGSETPITLPSNSKATVSYAKTEANCTRVLYSDEEGWQWLAIFKPSEDYESTPDYEFIRFSQGLHDSSIEDVYFGKSVIIILRATILAVHDVVSLRLLVWQLVPHARKNRLVDSSGRRIDKRILHVIEKDGIVLFEWTRDNIQIWNFGAKIYAFEPAPKTSPKIQHKKQLIDSEIRSGYAEWREEKESEVQMDRLRGKFNLDGLTEEEMIALAISQSHENQEEFEVISRQSSIVYEPSTDDEELRQVLKLSLHDQ